MNQLKYYKSMEFYYNIKNSGIPIMSQQEFSYLYGVYTDIDFIIRTSDSILTFKMAFKIPSIDYITEDETQKFINCTTNLSKSMGIKCFGYFIGNVKLSDKAYEIFKKVKQNFSFCCDSDQNKLNKKILKLLYSNQLYVYESNGDCMMIDA